MRPAWSAVLALASLLTAGACDDTFTPIVPTDLHFSVAGFLDAAADTQWIRIMPVRSTTVTAPGPLGATVTVEKVGSGGVIELRDSVFRFSANSHVGSEGRFFHNYWTAERIEPGASYRFSAAGNGGPPAEATVRIPADFEVVEVWLRQIRTNGPDLVRVDGVRFVPFVGVENHYYDSCGPGIERLFTRVAPRDSSDHRLPIARWFQGRQGCNDPIGPVVEKREVLVVGSEAEWPSGVEYGPLRLGLRDPPSNISNAVGFLGGVLTKRLPYENCEIESVSPPTDYCRLRYDASSATLRGTVTDTVCGNQPVIGATVRLREIDPPPRAPRRVRFTRTDHLGAYEIGALEAAKRYALTFSRIGPDQSEEFEDHLETMTFAPGEMATRDVGLRRLVSCREAS